MLRYELGETDVGDIRFGISPLTELGLSLRAVRDPSAYPLQLPWLVRTERARAGLDTALLLTLVNDASWTPDFLNPRPASPLTRFAQEISTLRRMPTERFFGHLAHIHDRLPAPLRGEPADVQRRVVVELDRYWRGCIAPHWARMRTILEADIFYRGRQAAQYGLSAMLNGLSPRVSYTGHVVSVALHSAPDSTVDVAGHGMTLVPTMFTRRASAPIGADEPPMILYPARGQGAMWGGSDERGPDAAAALLGSTRARLLAALAEPASSTELGIRFSVSASAVNQHLRVLHAGGLVTAARYGRSMLYLRSELGAALLDGRHSLPGGGLHIN